MRAIRRAIWSLAVIIVLLAANTTNPAQARPQFAPVASVSLSVPSQVMIGQDFSFTAAFANTSDKTGYGPIIDLILPTNGADGNGNTSLPLDGITFVSATYLGAPVTAIAQIFPGSGITPTMVTEPYTFDPNGQPLPVYGTPGDTLVSLQLPFGSFTPGQPPAPVTINAHLSNYANPGVPLTILARGGYEYGATALNDWCCGDPTIVSPALVRASPSPTPTNTSTPTLAPTKALTPTDVPSAAITPTKTPAPVAAPSSTPTPSKTPTDVPSAITPTKTPAPVAAPSVDASAIQHANTDIRADQHACQHSNAHPNPDTRRHANTHRDRNDNGDWGDHANEVSQCIFTRRSFSMKDER